MSVSWVLVKSFVLRAYIVPIAFGILTIFMLRTALGKRPDESMTASSWLALGPNGTGRLGLLLLKKMLQPLSPLTG